MQGEYMPVQYTGSRSLVAQRSATRLAVDAPVRSPVDRCTQIDISPRQLLTTWQDSFVKLGFHLIMFFFYLYSMIVALIRDETH